MEIGLFFGTFNPIHNGHLLIAKSVIAQLKLDQIWFVLSPSSPFKNNDELLDKNIRADLINIALYKEKKMLLCKEEFKMKIPNYTIDTLDFLRNKYPDFIFKLLIGEDNFLKIKLWKNYSKILNNYEIIIYPRNNLHTDIKSDRTIKLDHKLIDISSSKIRNNIKLGLSISEYVPSKINKLIKDKSYYL
tara:strand:- start:346 stop:912 length:567 start_codon:yes stop_codon:yes gene_type:complete